MKKKIFTILGPSAYILFRTLLICNGRFIEGLDMTTLLIAFPITFFIQGILCAKNKVNIIAPILVALVSYGLYEMLVIQQFCMNYHITFAVFGLSGYGISLLVIKLISIYKTKYQFVK